MKRVTYCGLVVGALAVVMAGCQVPGRGASTSANATPTPISCTFTIDVSQAITQPPTVAFNFNNVAGMSAVAMSGAGQGWALGETASGNVIQGAIFQLSNGTWSQPVNTTASLSTLAMVTPSEGWAVGASYAHLNAGRWTPITPADPQTKSLYLGSISMPSASEGWAAGSTNSDTPAAALVHYANGTWTRVNLTTQAAGFSSVVMDATTDGWLAGYTRPSGTPPQTLMYHYQGGSWTEDTAAENALSPEYVLPAAMSMLSAHDGWGVGQNGIAHYCGGKWTPQRISVHAGTSVSVDFALQALTLTSPDEGWATGSMIYIGASRQAPPQRAVVLHYAHHTWAVQPLPLDTADQNTYLNGIAAASPSDVWAVGTNNTTGKPIFLHYNGSVWSAA